MDKAVALWRGRAHVLRWANDEFLRMTPGACIGQPVGELATRQLSQGLPLWEMMDRVYATGEPEYDYFPTASGGGRFSVEPRYRDGELVGVATCWTPLAVPARAEDRQPTLAS